MLQMSCHPLPRFGLLLLLILSLGGCSFTRIGYQNLDWFINWKLRDYVSLDREQRRWLAAEVNQHLAWHCSSELPRYRVHLLALREQATSPSVEPSELQAFTPVVEQEAARTLERLVPTISGLISRLDDRQISAIERNLAKQNREMRARYLVPDLEEQNRQRSARTQERLETWLGRLTPAQKQRVDEWAIQLEGHTDIWLNNREHWQTELLSLLQQREQPWLETGVRSLLLEPETNWSEAYRAQREQNSLLLATMLSDVLRMAEPRQRQHLERRATSLLEDLDKIRCTATG
jgi:hypothetical protein